MEITQTVLTVAKKGFQGPLIPSRFFYGSSDPKGVSGTSSPSHKTERQTISVPNPNPIPPFRFFLRGFADGSGSVEFLAELGDCWTTFIKAPQIHVQADNLWDGPPHYTNVSRP